MSYIGIKYPSEYYDIPSTLSEHILKNKIAFLAGFLSLSMPEITVLANKIKWIVNVISRNDFVVQKK